MRSSNFLSLLLWYMCSMSEVRLALVRYVRLKTQDCQLRIYEHNMPERDRIRLYCLQQRRSRCAEKGHQPSSAQFRQYSRLF